MSGKLPSTSYYLASNYITDQQRKHLESLPPDEISLSALSEIPVACKADLFLNQKEALIHSHRGMRFICSAGSSSQLSFRIGHHQNERLNFLSAIETIFPNIEESKDDTIIINCYPTGIQFPNFITNVECGAHPHLLEHSLKYFGNSFSQLVLVCQPKFLKYFMDKYPLSDEIIDRLVVVLGGAWYPHTLLEYLAEKWSRSVEQVSRKLFSSYGVSEVGLGIGSADETCHQKRLDFKGSVSKPLVLLINQLNYYVESLEGAVCITVKNSERLDPTLRYLAGDNGSVDGDYLCLAGRYHFPPSPLGGDIIETVIYGSELLRNSLTSQYWWDDGSLIFQSFRPITSSALTEEFQRFSEMPGIKRVVISELEDRLHKTIQIATKHNPLN